MENKTREKKSGGGVFFPIRRMYFFSSSFRNTEKESDQKFLK